MKILKENWGSVADETVWVYTVKDEEPNFSIQFTNLGATLNRFQIADKNGTLEDIVYGWDSSKALLENMGNSYLGATVGRTASTTLFGEFEIDGNKYQLTKNSMGTHHQHGGFEGFHKKRMKSVKESCTNDRAELRFEFVSPDGEEGYPGNLTGFIEYKIEKKGTNIRLSYLMEAKTDKSTPVSMVNHAYWNLDGIGTTIDNLTLKVNANDFLDISLLKMAAKTIGSKIGLGKKGQDPMEIKPLGKEKPLLKDPMQFTEIFEKYGTLDDNYILDETNKIEINGEKLHLAAELRSPLKRRKMTIYTTEPAIIIYAGNFMDKINTMGLQCKKHYALCLETCKPTNSVRLPQFKDRIILKPGDVYHHYTVIDFEINSD